MLAVLRVAARSRVGADQDHETIVNFGGYEIVEERSRSPLGITAIVRGPSGGDDRFFLHVQYKDPIAAPGEERVVVDSFLEAVRIQQGAGDHWARIHAVGEIDEGAFCVTDLYPRSVQSLVHGRTRLSGSDLKQVVLGAIDALLDLNQRFDGRAHGALELDRVLIDDSAGPGRWKVVLTAPSPVRWTQEDLADARLRDARALGSILLGLVEHRLPRSLPTRIDLSEDWKRVGGVNAARWVEAVNHLLDADLDPNSNWLMQAREEFSAIKTRDASGSKAPVLALVLLLVVGLGAGGYFLYPRQSNQEILPGPDFARITPEIWQDWIEGCRWIPRLESELDKEFPVDRRASMSGQAQDLIASLIEQLPSDKERRERKGKIGNAWRPQELFSSGPLLRDLLDEPEKWRLELDGKPNMLEKANQVIQRVRRIREQCSSPPVRGDIESLRDLLRTWGAGEDKLAGLDEAIAGLDPGVIRSSDQVVNLIKAVEAGATSQAVRASLDGLESLVEEVSGEFGQDTQSDPVISNMAQIVRSSVVSALTPGAPAADLYQDILRRTGQARDELKRVRSFRERQYGQLDRDEFIKLLDEEDVASLQGLSALGQWRKLGTDPRVVLLVGDRDPFETWREQGGAGRAVANVEELIAKVRSLPQAADEPEILSALPELEELVTEIETMIQEALSVPHTVSNESDLLTRRQAIQERIREVTERAGSLVSAYSKTLDDVVTALDAAESYFSNEKVLADAMRQKIQDLRKAVGEAQSLPEDKRNMRASELLDEFEAERFRLDEVRKVTNRELNLAQGTSLNPAPLREVFEQFRQQLRKTLAESGQSPPEGAGAPLDELGGSIEQAFAAAAKLNDQLDHWVSVGSLNDPEAKLTPQIGDDAVRAAFAESTRDLRNRLDSVKAFGNSPIELLGVAQDVAAAPELRRAAFELALGPKITDWPATAEDLNGVLIARDSLEKAVQATDGALWSMEEIQALSQGAWRRAMGLAPDEAAFARIRQARSDFSVGVQVEGTLPLFVRQRIALSDLKATFRSLNRTDDQQADDGRVKQLVQAWLDGPGAQFDSDTQWILELRAAMQAETTSAGDFDPGKYGPGTVGWNGRADEAVETIQYDDAGGLNVEFRRVETTDDATAWFLATTEVSLEQFLEVMPDDLAAVEQFASEGPRGWIVEEGQVLPAGFWFEYRNLTDFLDDPLYSPDLLAPNTEAELVNEQGERKEDMPVQQVSLELAQDFCKLVGCVLPPEQVWRAAAEDWFTQAGLGGISINGQSVSTLGLQLRDATWQGQEDYFDKLPIQGQRKFPSHKQWKSGLFEWGGGESVWPVDDGRLYFAVIDSPPGAGWKHLVGNVGEIVSVPGGFAAIGGSAMSPPDVPIAQPVSLRSRDLPAADIGFRLAFSVPTSVLNPTVYRRVDLILQRVEFPTAGP